MQARFFYHLLGQIAVANHFMLSLRSIAVTDDGKSAHFFVYQIGFLEESVQVGALAFFIDTGGPVDGKANGNDTPATVTAINNMVEVDQVRLW